MHKALKITLIVLGTLVGLALIFLIVLLIAGSQEITDPFDGTGIEVIDAPFAGETVTMTWKVHGTSDATGVYMSARSIPDVASGTTPSAAGYSGSPIAGTGADGAYSAAVSVNAPLVYARVWARIDGVDTWSSEFPIARSLP